MITGERRRHGAGRRARIQVDQRAGDRERDNR